MHKLPPQRLRSNGSIIPPVVKLTTLNALNGPAWFDIFTTRVYTSGRIKARFNREFGRPKRKGVFNVLQRRAIATTIRDLKRHIMSTSDF